MASANRTIIATSLLLLVAICGQSARADLGEEEYQCPLFGPYAVHRYDLRWPDQQFGLYQLVKVFGSASEYIVLKLKKIAVNGPLIVGTTEKGYFILDTSQPEAEPQNFTDADKWQAALRDASIPATIQLQNPDTLAAAMPDQQLHPMDYRLMRGRFGLSDGSWSGIVVLAGLILMFMRSLLVRSTSSPLAFAVLLGLIVAFVAQIVLGDGPAFIVAVVEYPVIFYLVGQMGRLFRKFVWEAAMRRRAMNSSRLQFLPR